MTHAFDWLMSGASASTLRAMRADGSLARALPEVDRLYGVPQTAAHHPEVDTGAHVELCLAMAERLNATPAARFAVLMHDLGKGVTDPAKWPAHVDHESTGVPLVRAVCRRFGVAPDWAHLAELVCEKHLHVHRAFEMRPQSVVALLADTGMEADAQLCDDVLTACECDARGRLGKDDNAYAQGVFLRQCQKALQALPMLDFVSQTREWQDRHGARLRAVKDLRAKHAPACAEKPSC